MAHLYYRVVAHLPDASRVQEYIDWLVPHHLDAVKRAGAQQAWAVRLDNPNPTDPVRIESHYIFASRDAFATYEKEHAPRLRQEGLEKFGPSTGIRFERFTGDLLSL